MLEIMWVCGQCGHATYAQPIVTKKKAFEDMKCVNCQSLVGGLIHNQTEQEEQNES